MRVPVGAGSVHVERYGHGGEAILLLHGFGTCAFLWRDVGPLLAEAGYAAYAMDLLGFGESDRPVDTDFGIEAQVTWVDRAMTALRIPHAAVVGIDLGGAVALRLAVTRPERVQRLVLINALAFEDVPAGDITSIPVHTARSILRVSRGVMGATALLTPLLEGSVSDPAFMPTRLVARYLAPYVGRDGVRHLLALARSVDADDVEDLDLAAIRAPTLVIWGDLDRWADPRTADRLIGAIPGACLERLPDVGRLSPEECPDRLAELIIGFLRQHAAV